MNIPRYQEFHNYVKPLIKNKSVKVVTVHSSGDEITSLLDAYELRRLADYLDSL